MMIVVVVGQNRENVGPIMFLLWGTLLFKDGAVVGLKMWIWMKQHTKVTVIVFATQLNNPSSRI